MTSKEKFLAMVSKEETKTIEGAKGRIARKNYTRLSQKIAQINSSRFPRWSGTHKNPKLALYTPQWTPLGRAPALPVATQPAWSRT